MAQTILVGVDNSETALRAAQKAASLAAAFGAELHVVSAFSASMSESVRSMQSAQLSRGSMDAYPRLIERYRENAEGIASTVAEALKLDFADVEMHSRAVEGSPAVSLVREAERLKADIIVVGNKRMQGPARILGSIARTVAAEADCDLYVVNTRRP